MTAGHFIRAKREALHLTRDQLARRIGTSAGYLSRIESDAAIPSARMIVKLCEALQASPDELFAIAGVVPHDVHRWVLDHLAAVRALMAAEPA